MLSIIETFSGIEIKFAIISIADSISIFCSELFKILKMERQNLSQFGMFDKTIYLETLERISKMLSDNSLSELY